MTTLAAIRPVLVLVPRLSDGRIILLRQGRAWQLPTCLLHPGADLAAAASELLHRTTDYIPGELWDLGPLDAGAHCCLADQLRPSPFLPVHTNRPMTTALRPAELKGLLPAEPFSSSTLRAALHLLDTTAR